jgi:tetratricopeptide (TPR) repeat protein
MFKTVKRVTPVALALLAAPILTLTGATCARAQDAFNSAGASNLDQFDYSGGQAYPAAQAQAPMLQGATNGTLTVDEDVYNRQSRMPNGRMMLGESLCDLTTREIAADDEEPPPDFPPLPKRISIPKDVNYQKAIEKQAQDTQDNDVPVSAHETQWVEGVNSFGGFHVKYVSREAVQNMSKLDSEAGDNPDFTAQLAVMSLKMQHEVRPKNFFEQAAEMAGNGGKPQPESDDFAKMYELKKSLLKIKASDATPAERAKQAEKLEKSGKYYDALVERLRCVDLLDDGPSRFFLARLYNCMGEKKLAFETFKDAVANSWPVGDRDLLIECHISLGDSLFDWAKDALRSGNSDLNILRLRNASVSYRRAATMDRHNKRATMGLIKVAREAVSLDPSFDNYLLLGGAYLIDGDLNKAHAAYDECAGMAPENGQLKQAWMIYQLAMRRRDQSPGAEGVVTARRRQAEPDGETLVSSRKQR